METQLTLQLSEREMKMKTIIKTLIEFLKIEVEARKGAEHFIEIKGLDGEYTEKEACNG